MSALEQRSTADAHPNREAAKLLHHVRALADMTSEVAAAHDLSTTTRLLLLTLLGALSATRGVLWIYEPEDDLLRSSAIRGLTPGDDALPLSSDDAATLKQASPTILLSEGDPCLPALRSLREHWPELVVAAPLVVREELVGLLAIGAKLN